MGDLILRITQEEADILTTQISCKIDFLESEMTKMASKGNFNFEDTYKLRNSLLSIQAKIYALK